MLMLAWIKFAWHVQTVYTFSTCMDLFLAHRVPPLLLLYPFECLACLVVVANYLFIATSTWNRTQAACMGGLCPNYWTMMSPYQECIWLTTHLLSMQTPLAPIKVLHGVPSMTVSANFTAKVKWSPDALHNREQGFRIPPMDAPGRERKITVEPIIDISVMEEGHKLTQFQHKSKWPRKPQFGVKWRCDQ